MLSYHNTKINHLQEHLGVRCAAFDLPCGWTCPFAKDCRTKVIEVDGKRHAEMTGKFQCYASKAELLYPSVYRKRQVNLAASKADNFAELMIGEIKSEAVKIVRIHSSGDFYNGKYIEKWINIIESLPEVTFFGYTKDISVVLSLCSDPIPNWKMTYSYGGRDDEEANKWNIPICYVDLHGERVGKMPVIDASRDSVADYNYIMSGTTFAIRVH